jgi:hypothetical protein
VALTRSCIDRAYTTRSRGSRFTRLLVSCTPKLGCTTPIHQSSSGNTLDGRSLCPSKTVRMSIRVSRMR